MTVPTTAPATQGNAAATTQTQSNGTGTPPAGASSGTVAPKPGEMTATESALALENTKLRRQFDMKTVETAKERKKWEGEKKALTTDAEWAQKIRKLAPIDRATVGKELWGDNWLQQMIEHQANGNHPSPEAITAEMDRREKAIRDDIAAKEAARADAEREATEKNAAAQRQAQQRQYVAGIASQIKGAEADFPMVLDTFGGEMNAAAAVQQRIIAKWKEAAAKDPSAKPMQWREAADSLESELLGMAKKALAHPKYAAELKSLLTSPLASGGNAQSKVQQPSGSRLQQSSSKTLSNDLTASTQARRAPAVGDEEREQRARAAYEAALPRSS